MSGETRSGGLGALLLSGRKNQEIKMKNMAEEMKSKEMTEETRGRKIGLRVNSKVATKEKMRSRFELGALLLGGVGLGALLALTVYRKVSGAGKNISATNGVDNKNSSRKTTDDTNGANVGNGVGNKNGSSQTTNATNGANVRNVVGNKNGTSQKIEVERSVMKEEMKKEALDIAIEAFKRYSDPCEVAYFIKAFFDTKHGPSWHCIVGDFGSCVSQEDDYFIYFYVGSEGVVLYKCGPRRGS